MFCADPSKPSSIHTGWFLKVLINNSTGPKADGRANAASHRRGRKPEIEQHRRGRATKRPRLSLSLRWIAVRGWQVHHSGAALRWQRGLLWSRWWGQLLHMMRTTLEDVISCSALKLCYSTVSSTMANRPLRERGLFRYKIINCLRPW